MLFFNHDPLRDPIWQFIGGIISASLGFSGLVLPYLLPGGKNKKERLNAYAALIHQDDSLGCAGSLGLLFLLIIAPGGSAPAEFARQRRFPVFSSLENYTRSLS
jgi:hypothetical protein